MMPHPSTPPARTATIRRALAAYGDSNASDDLLFLEDWEAHASPDVADLLRVHQIRRANPDLAARLRAEIDTNRQAGKERSPRNA